MRLDRISGAFLLATFVAHIAPAQNSEPYIWKNVTVGAGGFIPGIVFSRVERRLAYLRTDMGGCYRWAATEKRWVPMHDSVGESSYFGGESIAADPIDANVVYIAAGMYRSDPSAIMRSRDKGKSWEIFPVNFRMGGNEDGRGLGERLAVDPNANRILYFGSRHDGLQRSEDFGEHWTKVESFPIKGRGPPAPSGPTHPGLSFVVFDPTSGTRGSPTKTIFVGSAEPGEHHLFRSDDAGQTWQTIAGEPKKEFLPAKAELDEASGALYITYCNGVGPNGVTDGSVMKFDRKSGRWTDITPDKSPDRAPGGYMGLSLDRSNPGTLAVATMNRWKPVDTIWRSTDGGTIWKSIEKNSQRDVSATPFLYWGQPKEKLGWWMAALAIDPFDSNHACYATGATIYATNDCSNVSNQQPTHWRPWVAGIEQTAVITLLSPSAGPHLLSGFGDIGGFVHDDLDVSPPQGMYDKPMFGNTNTLDFAEQQPNVIVRSGQPHQGQESLAWSDDAGRSWHAMQLPQLPANDSPTTQPQPRRRGWRATPALTTSADGSAFMLMTRTPMITRDRGQSWTSVSGLFPGARPVADRVDPKNFYALDFDTGKFYASADGGANFSPIESSAPLSDIKSDQPTWHEAPWPLIAAPGRSSDLWFVSKAGLYHSTDAGKSFQRVGNAEGVHVDILSFGKEPPGSDYPALFAIGTLGQLKAIWRSDDAGKTWIRINDAQHQYGTRFRCISGDPRVFGRVYVGTDGRGILYAEPLAR